MQTRDKHMQTHHKTKKDSNHKTEKIHTTQRKPHTKQIKHIQNEENTQRTPNHIKLVGGTFG